MTCYDKVTFSLVAEIPEFVPDADSIGLQYLVAGDFARFLLDAFRENDLALVQRGLVFIENLYFSDDAKVKELATVGYLEDIQNIWGNKDVDTELIFSMLGKESKKWWVELNRFWDGQIKYLGETYAIDQV